MKILFFLVISLKKNKKKKIYSDKIIIIKENALTANRIA